MAKAILYARFSPRRNADECESIETQVDRCSEFCGRNGHELLQVCEDREKSGGDGLENRPGLADALAALRRGYVLVVYRRDRLSRDMLLSLWLEKEVRKKGASIVSVSGEGTESDDPSQVLMRRIVDAFAEYERMIIKARTKAAMRRHQANGRRMSNRTPYGWAQDQNNPARLVEDQQEQVVIRQIQQLSRDGKGLREICRELDGTCRGNRWHHSTIKNILRRCPAS